MFILPLILAVAFVGLCTALAFKWKKVRWLMGLMALLGLAPAALFGVIAVGQGALIGYPGDPQAAAEAFFAQPSDELLLGSTGLELADSEEVQAVLELMQEQRCLRVQGAPQVRGFQATLTAELVYLDLDAWLEALETATVEALDELVQSRPKKEVFTEDGEAYLDGIGQEAYELAFQRMLDRGAETQSSGTLELTMYWTPFGWKLRLDEPLLLALEGSAWDTADKTLVRKGQAAQIVGQRLTEARTQILDGLPLIRKVYTIAEDALMGCEPDPAAFGSTTDPQEVLEVIRRAEPLLKGRSLSWNPDIAIKPGSSINYYYDESILAIQWKEFRNWSLVTYAEVVIADGSQIRRCIAGDSYRSFDWETPTEMSQRTNAVVAITGDFYMFRAVGIMVYQGQIYRDDPQSLHHLFVTRDGDLLMTKSWEVGAEDAAAFVEEHDVSFSLGFGPAIIENGEKLPLPNYLVGEFYDDYPRAAIGEVDDLHYILMTVGKEGPRENQTVTLPEAVDYILEKGVQTAYSLDGGRTANMTFHGELTNDPKYREERTMSDLIYFASAIPESER